MICILTCSVGEATAATEAQQVAEDCLQRIERARSSAVPRSLADAVTVHG